jgi:uncharacterized membrane protein YphA (DoxX/SURF4 family)
VLAVMALVALRLALGFHFLYEGVWKIKPFDRFSASHPEDFTAEPFLTQAKGPISGLFYAMLPDVNGRERLQIASDAKGRISIDSSAITQRWKDIRHDFLSHYQPPRSADAAAQASYERLARAAERTYNDFLAKAENYLKANTDEIVAHFGALDRFESDKERNQEASYQKQRHWDRMMELRHEADKWIKDLGDQETAFKNSLYSLLDEQQAQLGRVPASWNPLRWERMEQINFAVTYGLTAIGLCLILGLGTPAAALGGAAFMCFVVMTQPAFAAFYPPDPHVVGHALFVNKDFVEMVALLVVAASAAGRWGGLDYFLYHFVIGPFFSRKTRKSDKPATSTVNP